METEVNGNVYFQLSTGQVFKFIQCSKGMYYFDADQVDNDKNIKIFNHYTNIQTLKDNRDFLQSRKLKERKNQGVTKKTCVFQVQPLSNHTSEIT